MGTTVPTPTVVRHVDSLPPRHWWQRHGSLLLEVTVPHGYPVTITLVGGTRESISRQLRRRLGVTDWTWSR